MTVAIRYATRVSVTTGRCLRPWWKSAPSRSRVPGSLRSFADGAAQ